MARWVFCNLPNVNLNDTHDFILRTAQWDRIDAYFTYKETEAQRVQIIKVRYLVSC